MADLGSSSSSSSSSGGEGKAVRSQFTNEELALSKKAAKATFTDEDELRAWKLAKKQQKKKKGGDFDFVE